MVNIKRVGSNSFGFLKRKINENRPANRDKIYGEQYRKAFNIKQTQREKSVKEREEQDKRDKTYAEQYRKTFNIKQTHQERLVAERKEQERKEQEKLVQERKEQKQKKFAERKRIIAKIIGLNNKRKRRIIKHKKKGIRYREKVVTRYRYI